MGIYTYLLHSLFMALMEEAVGSGRVRINSIDDLERIAYLQMEAEKRLKNRYLSIENMDKSLDGIYKIIPQIKG